MQLRRLPRKSTSVFALVVFLVSMSTMYVSCTMGSSKNDATGKVDSADCPKTFGFGKEDS